MGYTDMYRNNKKLNRTENLNVSIFKFQEQGEMLIGKLIGIGDFISEKFDNKCKQYVFETDEGKKKVILGSTYDTDLACEENLGKIMCITWNGKVKLDSGREFNKFVIEAVVDEALENEKYNG